MHNHAAIFEGKRLVIPSSCPLHPKYQGMRLPTSTKEGCTCKAIYYDVEDLPEHEGKTIMARRFEAYDPIVSWDEHR